ncbi:hypothetical protein [Fodinicola feengrottensis]|uniref:Uncharacterized protein n=1 Tax=Fodinicola feengrottensis TaxID=435914 RepID=A0ABP4T8V1_9ACTN|nr:hypothetical protein [Fodinicola feengrottensis]
MIDKRNRPLWTVVGIFVAIAGVLLMASPANANVARPMGSASNAHIGISNFWDGHYYYTKARPNSSPSGSSLYGHWQFWDHDHPNSQFNTQEMSFPVGVDLTQNATWGYTCAVFWIHNSNGSYSQWGPAICATA